MRRLVKNTGTDVPAFNLWISYVGSYPACCGVAGKNTPSMVVSINTVSKSKVPDVSLASSSAVVRGGIAVTGYVKLVCGFGVNLLRPLLLQWFKAAFKASFICVLKH